MLDVRRREFISLLGGAAAAWPLGARAQQPAMPVIGLLSARSLQDSSYLLTAFRQGLREAGFVEGENVSIEYRWAIGQYDRLPALASNLVSRGVAVIAAVGGDMSAIAAKRATSVIPIVFTMGGDPITAGVVESFNRPGGNATGFTLLTTHMESKRVGLLHELVPGVALIGTLVNPNIPSAVRQSQELEQAVRTIGSQLLLLKVTNDMELDDAFAALLQHRIGALLVAADVYFIMRRDRIIVFAAQNRLPAIYQLREFAVAGGLMSYGPSIPDAYRQAGLYSGRILMVPSLPICPSCSQRNSRR